MEAGAAAGPGRIIRNYSFEADIMLIAAGWKSSPGTVTQHGKARWREAVDQARWSRAVARQRREQDR